MNSIPAGIKPLLLSVCLLLIGGFIAPLGSSAAFFSQSYIRLDRMVAGESVSGIACAAASSEAAGIESKVSLTFPTDFVIDPALSAWTVSVGQLPTGAVPWPSVGSGPTGISGQTATFSSADLDTASLYCFRFSSASSTIGSPGQKMASISTYSVADVLIDSRQSAVDINSSDQISVTGTIAPRPPDLINSLQLVAPTGSTISQSSYLEYQLTYGTVLQYATDLTLQATWSLGTIRDETIPSVSLLDYVDGSADSAYGGAPAIVNTQTRTITWYVTDLPANTQGQVRFKLHTRSDFSGSNTVSFTVTTSVANPDTTAFASTISRNYLFDPRLQPTPQPSQSSPMAVPTSTPSIARPAFSQISLWSVSPDSSQLSVILTEPAVVTLSYGIKPDQLFQSVTSLQNQTQHSLRLDNLKPDTQYLFRLSGRNTSGRTFTSGLYTFTTASSTQSEIKYNPYTFIAISSGQLIFDPTYLTDAFKLPYLVVPQNIDYEIKFSLTDPAPIETARILVKPAGVLGWSSVVKAAETDTATGEVLEINLNAFTSRLTAPGASGDYEIYVQTTDVYGNQHTVKLADLFVTDYLTVADSRTKSPIEAAQVNFYLFDTGSRTYKFISPQILPLKNPSYTNRDGLLQVALPPLSYRLEVNAIGYKSRTVDFSLRPGSHSFPQVTLDPEPFVPKTWFIYYSTILTDTLDLTHQYVSSLTGSSRFFQLSALICIIIFVILSFLSLRTRTNVPMLSLYEHFWRHTTATWDAKTRHERIIGQVIDKDTGHPISKAGVFVLDDRGKVVSHVTTDTNGRFALVKLFVGSFRLEVFKEGFSSAIFTPSDPLILPLVRVGSVGGAFSGLRGFFWNITSLLFEVFILASFICEILFGFFFSWWQALPFLLLSLANLILWLVYRIHLRA